MKRPLRDLLLTVAVLALAALFVRLGVWQLDRLEQRRERNAAWAAAMERAPLELDSATVAVAMDDPAALVNRRAVVSGRYEAGGELVLRGRSLGGRPGVHLVVPLVVDGTDAAVLVDRGWVPARDAATPETHRPPPPGGVAVRGVLLPLESGGGLERSVSGDGARRTTSVRRLDLAALRAESARPLLPVLLRQLPPSPYSTYPVPEPVPEPDEGPHLGYAIQWFSFAAIAVGGWLLLLRQRRRGEEGS